MSHLILTMNTIFLNNIICQVFAVQTFIHFTFEMFKSRAYLDQIVEVT